MDETHPVSRVRWALDYRIESGDVELLGFDDSTQRTFRLELPAQTLPALLRALKELIDAHPDRFPSVLLTHVNRAGELSSRSD